MNLQRKITNFEISGIQYLPRYVVILIDIILTSVAIGITALALDTRQYSSDELIPLSLKMVLVLGTNMFFFIGFKTYAGLIRHSSFADFLKLAFASGGALVVLTIFHYFFLWGTGKNLFSIIGLILYTVLAFNFQIIFRIFIKNFYHNFKEYNDQKEKKRIAILGIDDHSISLGNALTSDSGQEFRLVAFLTETSLKKVQISGKPVICIGASLAEALIKLNLHGVLIIGKNLTIKNKNEIVNTCMELGLQVFNAPLVEEWNSLGDVVKNIKSVEIEDLLDREPIQLDNKDIKDDICGKMILITGAAGSIGSELVRQIAVYHPKKLVLVDQAESPLYDLELELKEKFPTLEFKSELANISNKHRMEALFRKYNFSIVLNAAAYKHVPMIEKNPREAIVVNLLGTVNLASLSSKYKVRKFVMVSTDKAVNPTNVMGASKRAAEMYVQSFQFFKENSTQFITTRFGNVLGSNGSVIPNFRKQIAKGGPVTVTHPEIIRYFMTIPEACQLVLQAGTMGKGGEIFIFDMGKPVKILDLAKRMIKLSGFQPYKDIDIHISGLRPGEKLFEELISDSTTTLPTHNKKIMISREIPLSFKEVEKKTNSLIRSAIKATDKREMVKLLKELVPEYISMNSHFEVLDMKKENRPLPSRLELLSLQKERA